MKLLTNISLYTIANILAKFFVVLAIPIIAHNLTVEEYGSYTIILSLTMLSSSFFLMGSEHSLNFYFHKYKSKKNKLLVINTLFAFVTVSLLVLLPLIHVIMNDRIDYLSTILLWVFVSVIYLYFIIVMRANFDVKNFALLEIFRSIVYFVAVYLFVDKFQNGFDGAIDSNLISYVFSMILILYINIKKIKLYFSFTLLLKLLSFGVPFILSSLILWASTQSDRYFLMYFKDDYILGVYGFSLSIASIFILIKTSIKNAIDPYIMKLHHYREKKLKRIISELYTVSLFLFSFMFLIASFFMKDITLLIGGDKFTDSIIYTPYVILIVLITTVNQYFIYGINFNHRNGLVLKCLIYSLIINLILSVILINIWGVAGIILANVISSIIYSYLLYRESNKLYPIEYLKLDNLRIVFSALIVFGIDITYLSNNEYVSHIVIILMFLLINQRVYFNFKSIYALN